EALARDLECWLRGEPISARSVGSATRLWLWCRRNPALTAAAAAVLVTVAVAFVLITLSRNDAWQLAAAKARLADEERRQREQVQRQAAWLTFHQAVTLCEKGDVAAGLLRLADALEQAEQAQDADLARLVRANLAGWARHVPELRAVLEHK